MAVRVGKASRNEDQSSLGIARTPMRYGSRMVDLKFQVTETESVEVDADTLAAIDRGIADAAAGRSIPLDQARKLIPEWVSKFESPKKR